mgnify:CR=1 FL=1
MCIIIIYSKIRLQKHFFQRPSYNFFLYRQAGFLDMKEKKLLCSAMLQSRFDFACSIWFRSSKKTVKLRLQTAQNKMMRYILGYHSMKHLYFEDFNHLRLLDVENRVDFLSLNTMYNISQQTAPLYLIEHVPRLVPKHFTRRSQFAFIVSNVKSHGCVTFKFNGVKLWNELPFDIKTCDTKDKFKKKCKQALIEHIVPAKFESAMPPPIMIGSVMTQYYPVLQQD